MSAKARGAARRAGLLLALTAALVPYGSAGAELEVLPGGTAAVTLRDSGRHANPAPLLVQSVRGIYLEEPAIMTVSMDALGKTRGLVLVIHGHPQSGKSYPLGSDPEAGPAALRYLELTTTGGPELEKMRLHRKAWVSTAGAVTVTAYAGQAMKAEVSGAVMAPEQGKENEATGSFRIDLKCDVSGIVDM